MIEVGRKSNTLEERGEREAIIYLHDTGMTSGTSSRMKGPSLPFLNRVRNFFDTINRASEAFWFIFSAFCRAPNCWSIRHSKSFSSSTLPSNSVRVE